MRGEKGRAIHDALAWLAFALALMLYCTLMLQPPTTTPPPCDCEEKMQVVLDSIQIHGEWLREIAIDKLDERIEGDR